MRQLTENEMRFLRVVDGLRGNWMALESVRERLGRDGIDGVAVDEARDGLYYGGYLEECGDKDCNVFCRLTEKGRKAL
ncbi:MAG: hypothetical protein LUE27_00410 [Clostridia bacterium]|nr:hypothetical protein [Clostridia bacterium]